MKLPLLLKFVPRIAAGPTVMLEKGNWMVESNHKDSNIEIALNSKFLPLLPDFSLEFSVDSDALIYADIKEKGTEREVTIFVHKVG